MAQPRTRAEIQAFLAGWEPPKGFTVRLWRDPGGGFSIRLRGPAGCGTDVVVGQAPLEHLTPVLDMGVVYILTDHLCCSDPIRDQCLGMCGRRFGRWADAYGFRVFARTMRRRAGRARSGDGS